VSYWGREGVKEVDTITKNTINQIIKIGPAIKALIKAGTIKEEQLFYDPLLDSTEIIP
jgi:hypothetical protein